MFIPMEVSSQNPRETNGGQKAKTFSYLGWEPVEKAAISTLPYFTEPCEGRTWDTSGRLYRRSNYPLEKNLIVPKVRWVSEFKVLIYGG